MLKWDSIIKDSSSGVKSIMEKQNCFYQHSSKITCNIHLNYQYYCVPIVHTLQTSSLESEIAELQTSVKEYETLAQQYKRQTDRVSLESDEKSRELQHRDAEFERARRERAIETEKVCECFNSEVLLVPVKYVCVVCVCVERELGINALFPQ